MYEFCENAAGGEVYNLGGGKENSCSILEAFPYGGERHRQKAECTRMWTRIASATTSATTAICGKCRLIIQAGTYAASDLRIL